MDTRKNLRFSEGFFLLGLLLLGLGTAFMAKADFGLSAIIAPSYVLAEIFGTAPGTMNYLFYTALLLLLCLIRRGARVEYLFVFLTALLFGWIVNGWTWALRGVTVTTLPARIPLYCVGLILSSFSLALIFQSYFPPQAPELFVKEISALAGWDMYRVKHAYDILSLILAITLSLLCLGRLRHVGIGTVVNALINGPTIGFFAHRLERRWRVTALFPKLERWFTEKR